MGMEKLLDSGCLGLTDDSNSYDSFMHCDCESGHSSFPEEASGESRVKNGKCCVDCATPRRKADGSHRNVRRKLVFSPEESCGRIDRSKCKPELKITRTDTAITVERLHPIKTEGTCGNNVSDKSSTTTEPDNVLKPKDQNQQPAKPPVEGQEGTKKVAHLVVWTKKGVRPGKGGNNKPKPEIKENSPIVPAPDSQPTEPEEVSKLILPQPPENLFFVHCPSRGSDAAKKVKPQKRMKKASPISNKRQAVHKKRPSDQQTSSSGRAYRAYLHTCLEKQRQQLLTGADFKVEKLFQPDQGIALPGEIAPPSEPQSCAINSAYENVNTSIAATAASTFLPQSNIVFSSAPKANAIPTLVTASSDTFDNPSSVNNLFNPPPSFGGSEDQPIFELPDAFTVTTGPNEFDLLIQNVVREEMVDGDVEDDLMCYNLDSYRKRMKMSNENGSIASEDRLVMDETGKPRCTYTELIEKALTESGGLTVSEIYNWISERYPFFKPDDDRWKNSVRHNLSINPYFKKGEKARSGAGHLWTISEESKGLRPSMVRWDDERRKSPSDLSDFIMPIESETDRAVANILGQYVSECRANREASNSEENQRNSSLNGGDRSISGANQSAANPVPSASHEQPQPQQTSDSGATCNTLPELNTFNLNELNSGQFTVDLGGITIPEGGTINFEELMNSGRLIYIQTDPDANKENDSTQAVVLNECMLSELTSLTGTNLTEDDTRFNSFYSDQMSIDLGFGKGDAIQSVGFPNDVSQFQLSYPTPLTTDTSTTCQETLTCGQLVPQSEVPVSSEQPVHQDLTSLDQVIPMSYEMMSSGESSGTSLPENLHMNAAALFESKELGLSYTFQTEPSSQDLLSTPT